MRNIGGSKLQKMTPEQLAFHSEEYKQIRSEVITLLARVESLFRYSIIVVASVSAWLVSNSLGLTGTAAGVCLKLPRILLMLGWLISPAFVVGAGLMAAVANRRIKEMGDYLQMLEEALGHGSLGWERYLKDQETTMAPMTERLWYAVLVVALTAAAIALLVSYSTNTACST